jgi:hypothetical protein
MGLQLSKSLPNNWTLTTRGWTSVRKFTEIYTVLKDLIDRLEKITSGLTIRTTDI